MSEATGAHEQVQSTFGIVFGTSEEDARAKMTEDVVNHGGTMLRGDLSKASARWQLATTTPLARVLEVSSSIRVNRNAIRDGRGQETQRPIDESHAKEIAEYLRDRVAQEMPYWFGQLAFNVGEADSVALYTTQGEVAVKSAYMVIRPAMRLYPVDGNHRLAAFEMLREASADGDTTWDIIKDDCVQFCVIDEPDPERARQLFVDAAKAKPLPPSLLVSFSSLDLFPSFVKSFAEATPLFRGRIDRLSKSLGKNPKYILTMNQLRVVLAEFVFGATDRRTIEQSAQQYQDARVRRRHLEAAVEFFEHFARSNSPVWGAVIRGEFVNMYEARQSRVDFTTSGLQMIARVGHSLYFGREMAADARQAHVARLGQLAYDRTARIWQGNIVKPDGRIGTQQGDIDAAFRTACEAIGL